MRAHGLDRRSRCAARRPRGARAGARAGGLRRGGRARRALAGRVRLLVCPHLGHAGPRGPAHHHRARHRARVPRPARFNIGAEGQFYAGAIAATWAGPARRRRCPGPSRSRRCSLAAALAGALWVAVPVVAQLRYGVLEVISTLLLNFVAEALVSLMVQGPLQESQGIYPQSDAIAESARLPLLPGTRLHAGILLALAGAAGAPASLRPHALGLPAPRRRAGPAGRRDQRQDRQPVDGRGGARCCRARSPGSPAASR